MSWTDVVESLATQLFDDHIVALTEQRRSLDAVPYFPSAPDPGLASYFVPAPAAGDLAFPGDGKAEGLIVALGEYWSQRGEVELAALTPLLQPIAAALRREARESASDVDILCYTMF